MMKKKSGKPRGTIDVPNWLRDISSAQADDYQKARNQTLADFARSGLDAADVDKLGVVPVTPAQALEIIRRIKPKHGEDDFYDGFRCGGWVVPYYSYFADPQPGKIITQARLRLLGNENVLAAYGLEKYLQFDPYAKDYAGSDWTPRFYLSPLVGWIKIFADIKTTIYITEGEKKAACACKNGIITIGLGGGDSFKYKPREDEEDADKS